jgi:hypothetical protein
MKQSFSFSLIFILFITTKLSAQNNSIGSLFNENWSKITYLVDKQPVFDVSDIKTIIISEIVNKVEREDNHTIDIYDEFANIITNIDGLTLVDRSKTKSLLKEFKFQQASGLVDETQIRKLGDFYGTGLIIFGRIQTDNFSHSIKHKKSFVTSASGCRKESKRVGVYSLDVNLKIIDLKTAAILFSHTLKAKIKRSGPKYECQTPPSLDPTEFYQSAKEEIGIQLRELFTVHQKEYKINFQTHRKFNKDLKKAITYLKIDDFENGFLQIKQIAINTKDDKARSFALYNLAKMQMFNGEYKESLKNAKEAYLLNPKNEECLAIINELK